MSLEQAAYLAEIGGAVVVAFTLIFLTVQIGQNNKMLRSAATQHAHNQFAEIFDAFIGDSSFLDVYLRSHKDLADVTVIERARLNAYWMQSTINYQNWVLQTREGALDASLLDSYERLVDLVAHSVPFQTFWKERRNVFEAELVKRVDDIASKPRADAYRPFGTT